MPYAAIYKPNYERNVFTKSETAERIRVQES